MDHEIRKGAGQTYLRVTAGQSLTFFPKKSTLFLKEFKTINFRRAVFIGFLENESFNIFRDLARMTVLRN